VKRDDDLIRQLMIELIDSPNSVATEHTFLDMSDDEDKRSYHLQLLVDVDCLAVEHEQDYRKPPVPIVIGDRRLATTRKFRVTNSGQDYLQAIRDQGIWAKTKAVVAETGGNATIEIVKALALSFLKKKIEEQTGITL
jgi:Hypothetical protein (DUF2513)